MPSKEDIVYYTSYLGHMLERDDFTRNGGGWPLKVMVCLFVLGRR